MPPRKPMRSTKKLTLKLRRGVVAPIFAALPAVPEGPTTIGQAALPVLVVQNRRERAEERLATALASRGVETVPKALRDGLRALVRRWAELYFADGFSRVESFEVRCAEERDLLAAQASGDEADLQAAQERRYLLKLIEEHGDIEIRGLQTSERVHQKLELAYVPLHLDVPAEAREVQVSEGVTVTQTPPQAALAVLGRHPRVLIVGPPGSGKTTLVSYLAVLVASGELPVADGGRRLPFVVPVRSLAGGKLDSATLARAAGCEHELLVRALGVGRALLFLDGIDEALGEGAGDLLRRLAAFARRHAGVQIVVTSRPSGLPGEGYELPGFLHARLLALTREEIDTFIDRWCLAAEVSIQKDEEAARQKARRDADDLKDRVRKSRPVERLAETPLLCSILCVVHRFLGQRIPERRTALYEACTNVLLYEWDRTKFPDGAFIGKLDAQAKRALLGVLAWTMHRNGTAEIPESGVVKCFEEQMPKLGQSAGEAKQLIAQIRDRSGLLVEQRQGYFGFSHLSFQEYLVALHSVAGGKYDEVLKGHNSGWWHEAIVLASGLPGADAARIITTLLEIDGKQCGPGTMLAAQCMETATELPVSLRREIEERLATLIPPKSQEEIGKIVNFGAVAGPVLLRRLGEVKETEKAGIVVALGSIGHEPACSSIARLMASEQQLPFDVRAPLNITLSTKAVLGLVAAVVMWKMALHSQIAVIALGSSLPSASRSARQFFKYLADMRRDMSLPSALSTLLAKEFGPAKSSRQEKPRSRRGANSA